MQQHLTAGTRVRPVSQGEVKEEAGQSETERNTRQPTLPCQIGHLLAEKSHLEVVFGCHHPLESCCCMSPYQAWGSLALGSC